MMRGVFIALEGIDGSGKTTVRETIAAYIRLKNLTPVLTREPGGTPFAERVRDLILKDRDEPVSDKAEVLLFFTSREIHLNNVIRPHLEEGSVVISDRFVDSTYAYQAAGGSVDQGFIDALTASVVGDNHPDITFLFTVDPQVGFDRALKRGVVNVMDSKGIAYYERAQAEYLRRAALAPARYRVIDANRPLQDVQNEVIDQLEVFINDRWKNTYLK
jgi:dTMP kinase